MPQKKCTRCQQVKDMDLFAPSKVTRDKRASWCRTCLNEYNNSRRQRKPLPARPCRQCGTVFQPKVHNGAFCSERCRDVFGFEKAKELRNQPFLKCSTCQKVKPRDAFCINRARKTGRQNQCKSCDVLKRKSRAIPKELETISCPECGVLFCSIVKRQLKYCSKECQHKHHKRVTREKRRENGLKRAYGLTLEEYQLLEKKQNYRCAICGVHKKEARGKGSFHVDHCHETKKIRGLLCHYCNTAIGALRDDPEIIEAAARYVRKHRN